LKQCWYHDPTKTLEENKKNAQEKIKAKQEEKKKKKEEHKKQVEGEKQTAADDDKNKGVPHKGTYAQLPPKTEHAGMCLIRDACLYNEYSYAAGVHPNQVDFIYDSGMVSGVMGEKEINILKNVTEEDVLIETVTGKTSISKLYGDTIFWENKDPERA
jgi:mannitol-specific phosphotransferase system IIBC component